MQVGGYDCPTSGEIAGRELAPDGTYYLTTFGGGADAQPVACGGPPADGSWYYLADSWRFGCGARVLVSNPANGRGCVAQVADVGPNICVEQAAGRPVIDASPLVARALFGTDSLGWSSRALVYARVVDPATPLGPAPGDTTPPVLPAGPSGAATLAGWLLALGGAGVLGYLAWRSYAQTQLPARSATVSRRRRIV
jgi:hypothetical protein